MSYYVDNMEQLKLAAMRKKHPEWVWNRSDAHFFLAVPEQPDAFTSVVEPGNSFSPGPGTYGVSAWVLADGVLHTPEELPQEAFEQGFSGGRYPISESKWDAGVFCVETELFTNKLPNTIDYRDDFRVKITNQSADTMAGTFCLAIRSFGAAGGPVRSLSYEEGVVHVNEKPCLYIETPGKFVAVSYEQTGSDISVALRQGWKDLPAAAEDAGGWASGALLYPLQLAPGERVMFDFACHLHAGNYLMTWQKPLARPQDFDGQKRWLMNEWDALLSVDIDVPDKRFHDAFFAQIAHLYMATGQDAPHISPITYPAWWARDSAYILVALAKAGFADFAGRAAAHAGRFQISCAFGPEGDVPGERIWMLSEQYLLTRDEVYLRKNYEYIEENADRIVEMRHTDVPLAYFSENFSHQYSATPNTAFTCAPAADGLVMGRMDFSYPIFYVNAFCYLGLKRAAMCAEILGEGDAALYAREADALRAAMRAKAPGLFGQNERDTCAAFAPSGWADKEDAFLAAAFEAYWNRKWCPGGVQTHEPLWTYFEVGDARNRVLIGERDRAWAILDHYLDNHTFQGVYTWKEGEKDENSAVLAWERLRGWDKASCVTPHGWTGAEMLALLRDCLVREDESGQILIGSGVPASWADSDFGISNFPTYYGKISFRYTAAEKRVHVTFAQTAPAAVTLDLPFAATLA